jgi:hypothetical protein
MQTNKSPARISLVAPRIFSLAAAVAGMLEMSLRRPPLVTMALTSLHAAFA